jgi:hypothetical protein
VYSQVAIVLIGDFLLECRGTFIDKAGVAELNAFLRAIGVKKVYHALQPTSARFVSLISDDLQP